MTELHLKCAALLEVSSSATPKEIKAAFREKAKTLHPDIARNDEHADGRTFTELREAYEFLMSAASTKDAETNSSGAVYGPGMLARFEAANRWRERKGGRRVPIKAAREHSPNGDASASNVGGAVNHRGPQQQNLRSSGLSLKHFSLEQEEVMLQTVLSRHKAATKLRERLTNTAPPDAQFMRVMMTRLSRIHQSPKTLPRLLIFFGLSTTLLLSYSRNNRSE